MKKLLIISGSLPPIRCGVGYYTQRLIEEFSTQKISYEILSTTGVDQITVPRLRTVKNWKLTTLVKINRQVKQSGASIVHVQYPAVGYGRQLGINLLPYVLRLSGKRVLVTLHEYHESRLIGKVRDFITVLPANKIILSNEQDRLALPGFLRKKTVVIPIGPNIKRVPADPSVYSGLMKSGGLDNQKPTLLYFGFAQPNKNLEVLLDAMVSEKLADYQLLLLTELSAQDSYQAKILKQIDSVNSAKKRVAVAGFLSDEQVSRALQAGKYFVLPQHQPLSAKSSTAITAITHGLLLISSGSKNPTETLPFIDRQNSRLILGPSPEKLGGAVAELENSKELQDTIESGSAKLADYFSWQNIVKQHMEIYGQN
ncbi:MAG TPA: glycosyltransferase [Candidatus Saccharimonadales bacterium]|nr:glycosyltransferase [Candidatus Saccharimonadales bacterium]